jgi:hypothetical protein
MGSVAKHPYTIQDGMIVAARAIGRAWEGLASRSPTRSPVRVSNTIWLLGSQDAELAQRTTSPKPRTRLVSYFLRPTSPHFPLRQRDGHIVNYTPRGPPFSIYHVAVPRKPNPRKLESDVYNRARSATGEMGNETTQGLLPRES